MKIQTRALLRGERCRRAQEKDRLELQVVKLREELEQKKERGRNASSLFIQDMSKMLQSWAIGGNPDYPEMMGAIEQLRSRARNAPTEYDLNHSQDRIWAAEKVCQEAAEEYDKPNELESYLLSLLDINVRQVSDYALVKAGFSAKYIREAITAIPREDNTDADTAR